MKRLVKAGLRRLGYTLSTAPTLIAFLRSREIDVVLDVGANAGQFGSELREQGYRGRIVSFEPIADVFARLSERTSSDPRWEARQLALGRESRIDEINVSEKTEFSSFLSQTPFAVSHSSAARVVDVQKIDVVRLSDIYGEFSKSRVFLKVDTQGYEQQVLLGAEGVLDFILGVQLELPIEHLYAGSWSMSEAIQFMSERGFAISQTRLVHNLVYDPVSALELDCVFRRSH